MALRQNKTHCKERSFMGKTLTGSNNSWWMQCSLLVIIVWNIVLSADISR